MIATLIALLVSLAQAAPQPSGTIRGRVVDRDSGRPLVRAVVRLRPPDGDERIATTDEHGAFAVELPPGGYGSVVTARQHEIGALRAGNITLARGEVVDVVVRLAPTYGLDVRVVDPFGEPLSSVEVRVQSIETGRTPFSSMMHGTDDLGRVRLFGLPPGRYTVCAETDAMVFAPGSVRSRRDRLLPTCYPAVDEEHAEPVRIDRADLDGVEIRMRRGPTFSISGTVLDATGAPAAGAQAGFIHFIPNGSGGSGLMVDASGRFHVDSVVPGSYAISAGIPDQSGQRRAEAGFVEVAVVERDVDDLVVPLRKTADVQGRLVAEYGVLTLPPAPGSGIIIEAGIAGARMANSEGTVRAIARSDRTFTLAGTYGSRVLRFMNIPRGWYVKSVRYGDHDIIDTPVEFRSGTPVDVVLSDRGALLTGTVTGDDGAAARALVCLLRLAGPRGIEVVAAGRTTPAGVFRLGPVRGGEYALVALPPAVEVPEYAPQDRLARLAALGERVTLTDLDERSVPLRLVRER